MIAKVLLCSDGSPCALQATRIAARIARTAGKELIVVAGMDLAAMTYPCWAIPEAQASIEPTYELAAEMQDEAIRKTAEVLQGECVRFSCRAEIGHPAEVILRVAEEERVGLIVMGSRGASHWRQLLVGSTSKAVVRHAHCSVLILRGSSADVRRIVLASDGSAGARKAAQLAFALASRLGAEVGAVHVCDARHPGEGHGHRRATPSQGAMEQKVAALEDELNAAAGAACVTCALEHTSGHPAEAIVRFGTAKNADLIVLGSGGLGGFQRLVLGSVGEAVLDHAHCSVLIAR
jgi:nucleotide-binding universal stress UspA family protein